MPRLHNKISLITGAAQGIGLATALKFAKEGATVIVCDVKQAGVSTKPSNNARPWAPRLSVM
jgi:3-oxoacyl-[acyl-carrier protein] reductase